MDKNVYFKSGIGTGLKANLHFIHSCNARCRGCFSTTFAGEAKYMPLEQVKAVVLNLGASGIRYFNIAGGEPTLHPQLHESLQFINSLGYKASIITNGFRLSRRFIEENGEYLDTIGVSIDSFDKDTSYLLGRDTGSKVNPRFFVEAELQELSENLKGTGIKLKVNTVVSRLNYKEQMADKVSKAGVARWKIIKMSPYSDEKHSNFELIPTVEEYSCFAERNVMENRVLEQDMTNTYLVVDPDGNLLDNRKSGEKGSSPYSIVGNLLHETASEVLRRYFSIFKREIYNQRYLKGA